MTDTRKAVETNVSGVPGVRQSTSPHIAVRDFPFPFSAMLAICSDLDETECHDDYIEISRFLNTREQTRIGPGLGLEVGNTMYFDMAADEYAFWNATDQQRSEIIELIKSGHIDAFHSFGDMATSRRDAVRVLEHLREKGCKIRVWIDHAVASTNFGADIMRGRGDVETDPSYHADITLAQGVQYVWRGRVTSVIGQGTRRSLRGIIRKEDLRGSFVTFLKEFMKGLLGRFPGSRFRLHALNKVFQQIVLRDGQSVYEFLRSNPHPLGVSVADRGDRICEVISDPMLDSLVERRGTSIIYTHLGKTSGGPSIFPPQSVEALTKLAKRARSGQILVMATARLLDYHLMLATLDWTAEEKEDRVVLKARVGTDSADGLTFVVSGSKPVELTINNEPVEARVEKVSEDSHVRIVSVPIRPLSWPL